MDFEEFQNKSVREQIFLITEHIETNDQYLEWFCKVQDPRSKPPSSELFYALDVGFLQLAIQKIASRLPLQFILVLRIFAAIDGFEQQIISNNGVEALCEVLVNNIDNLEVTENACVVLGFIATNERARKGYPHTAIPALVKALVAHINNSRIIMAACKALNNACYRSIPNKIQFVKAEGFAKLISIFGDSMISDSAKQSAALLLRNICNMEKERAVLLSKEETLMDDILCVMQLTIENEKIQIHLLWALVNLTIDWDHAKQEIGEKGACVQILDVMRKFPSNVPIQKLACTALNQLADKPIIRKRLVQGEGYLSSLNKTLKKSMQDRDIVQRALEIISRLASGAADSKIALRAADTLPLLTDVITNHAGDKDIRDLANKCMSEVFQIPDKDEEDSGEEPTDSGDEDDAGERSDDDGDDSDPDQLASLNEGDFSLASLRDVINREQSEKKKDQKFHQMEQELEQKAKELELLKQELDNETSLRKKGEDDIKTLRNQLLASEQKAVHILRLENDKEQLKRDVESAQQQIAEVMIEYEKNRQQFEAGELQKRQALETQRLSDLNRYEQEINGLKQQILTKDSTIINLNSMLFHYISLSLKLHYQATPNFDKDELFQQLCTEQIPVEQWPGRIQTEIIKAIETQNKANPPPEKLNNNVKKTKSGRTLAPTGKRDVNPRVSRKY